MRGPGSSGFLGWDELPWILAVALGLAAGAAVCGPGRTFPAGGAFQEAASGLGLGALAAPRWSFHALDPRVAPADETLCAPLPGRPFPNPDASAGLSRFPEAWRVPPVPGTDRGARRKPAQLREAVP